MKNNMPMQAESWLEEHGDRLYRYAYNHCHDTDQAADLVQETLLGAWRSRDSFHGDSSQRTWLIGIMKHKITDLIRKRIKERNLFTDNTGDLDDYFQANNAWKDAPQAWCEHPEQAMHNQQLAAALHACIRALPQIQRDVFSMKELQDHATQDICQSCGISTTNFYVLMHRARLALRKCMTKCWGKES